MLLLILQEPRRDKIAFGIQIKLVIRFFQVPRAFEADRRVGRVAKPDGAVEGKFGRFLETHAHMDGIDLLKNEAGRVFSDRDKAVQDLYLLQVNVFG